MYRTNTAPSIGPLLGGVLAARLGWASIFWFLTTASGICLLLVITTLPETSRNVVGNGNIKALRLNSLPFCFPGLMPAVHSSATWTPSQVRKFKFHPLQIVRLLHKKDNALLVTTFGVLYMAYSCLQASLASIFLDIYKVGQLKAGLIYLPFGIGCMIAAYCSGTSLLLLAIQFRMLKQRNRQTH